MMLAWPTSACSTTASCRTSTSSTPCLTFENVGRLGRQERVDLDRCQYSEWFQASTTATSCPWQCAWKNVMQGQQVQLWRECIILPEHFVEQDTHSCSLSILLSRCSSHLSPPLCYYRNVATSSCSLDYSLREAQQSPPQK